MPKKHMFCAACGSTELSVYYPTPEAVGRMVIEQADISPGMTVLEPSAGTGNLASLAVEAGAHVDCIELQPAFAEQLKDSGLYHNVWCCDFVKRSVVPIYDRIIMNPPFEKGADMKHVETALWHLKPGGILVAIMSSMAGKRQSRADKAFAEVLEHRGATRTELPRDAFREMGTSVAADIVRIAIPVFKGEG